MRAIFPSVIVLKKWRVMASQTKGILTAWCDIDFLSASFYNFSGSGERGRWTKLQSRRDGNREIALCPRWFSRTPNCRKREVRSTRRRGAGRGEPAEGTTTRGEFTCAPATDSSEWRSDLSSIAALPEAGNFCRIGISSILKQPCVISRKKISIENKIV